MNYSSHLAPTVLIFSITALVLCALPGLAAAQGPATVPAPADVAAPPADAEKTASGLAFKVLEPGGGSSHPGASDVVTVNYSGWTTDGKLFDSTVLKRRPSTIPLANIMPGWREGLQLMVEGEKRRLWIPEELAYAGREGRPAGMLVFDVELVDFVSPPEAPATVAAAPADAEKTRSGLASTVLKAGTGTEHPTSDSTVTVHYTGWTTDGERFDSSITRGKPSTFPLNRVIAGWTEGVQLMVEGEQRRFWIPEDLAYKGQAGRPQGMLVFDIELISIEGSLEPPAAVAAAPADSEKTPSGLASKVLKPGAGTQHPRKDSTVTVHYTGWTTDGTRFDSSVERGTPSRFALDEVIGGWTEGLQLMVEGERRRFWIPEKLAYKGEAGKPQGMLVFDVELISIGS